MGLKDLGLRAARLLRREVRRRTTFAKLQRGDALRPGPPWVQVGIDGRCNYRCAMCWAHSPRLDNREQKHVLPRELFEQLVDDLTELGTKRIDICGSGEPLLHPHSLAMLRYVKSAGVQCNLTTNGSMLKPDSCRSLIEIGLDAISVSINSATDETHQRITGAPAGERARIMRMVKRLADDRGDVRRPHISTSFVVQRDNWREVVSFAEDVVEIGIDNVEIYPLGINEASRDLVVAPGDEREARRLVEAAVALLADAGLTVNARHYLDHPGGNEWSRSTFSRIPCHIGQMFCRVNADGSVNPCCACTREVGNISEQRFRDLWSSQVYRSFRRQAYRLPTDGRPLEGCKCYTCGHAEMILDYHEKLTAGRFHEIL